MHGVSHVARRVAVKTLGCKVNRVESERIVAELLGGGFESVDEQAAEIIVINTCTVTGEADAKARKAVRHALDGACRPIVVVTGCLAALDSDGLRSLGERVVVEADKAKVSGRIAEITGATVADSGAMVRAGGPFRTRAMVKVEDGCDNRCSYCIIPDARGVPRSTPVSDVVAEVSAMVGAGVGEVVLTGINLGRYRDGACDLAELVSAVARTGVPRLRLSSIEPPDLTERLLATLADMPAFCRHLHVPLQSGSDEVLRAMNRAYTLAEYVQLIDRARQALPGLVVTTDVIAGFPGESDANAKETADAISRIGFSRLHVFRYSVRPGTPAASMEQVPPPVKSRRAAELRSLGDSLQESFLSSLVGRDLELLVESVESNGVQGTSREYAHVAVSGVTDVSPGTLLNVVAGHHDGRTLYAEAV